MKRLGRWTCIFLASTLSFLSALPVRAQDTPAQQGPAGTGGIAGTVKDASGGAILKATVVVTSETTNSVKEDITDPQGHFSVTGLAAGQYTIDVSATGFSPDTHAGVVVAADQNVELPVTLKILSDNEVVTVEASDSGSVAAHLAPMDALLDEHSARTEIKPIFIKNFTAPTADFGELVEMAPGTFSISTNGVGLAQDKTYFRGFPDGDYDIDFDGVPFYDTNSPTHHTWSFFPPPWVGGVDFDRSPGSASTIGPTPFGGSIHLLSPEMLGYPFIQGSVTYGTWDTIYADGHFDSGPIWKKFNVSLDGQNMTSDGYQTFNYQQRAAGSAKAVYKFSDNNVLTGYLGLVNQNSNTPNNNATRYQIQNWGNNFLDTGNACPPTTTQCSDPTVYPLYYKLYTYHVPTDFEYLDWSDQHGGGWQTDLKLYTLRYWNHQFYNNPSYCSSVGSGCVAGQINDGFSFAIPAGPDPVTGAATNTHPGLGVVSAVDKLNSYRKYGEEFVASQVSKYGILRVGTWYEWAWTNRFQTPSNPLTQLDANLPNFHEFFKTNSFQPFAEYEWKATQRLTITGGFKYSYFEQSLKQLQDNGSTVGCLGGTLVGNPKSTPADSCTGGSPFTTHSAGYNSYLPSADANYRILPIWSAYGQYATGTIIPPSSVFDTSGAIVQVTPKPTGATTFQTGSVVKIKDVSLNVDYFHTHFTNTYVSIPDPTNTSAVSYTTGGDSVTQGFEGEATVNLTHNFAFYVNGTAGTDKYVTSSLFSYGLWVANAPDNTEAYGLTYGYKGFEIGIFDKRVGDMWNDNKLSLSVPAASGGVPGTLTFSGTNPAGNGFSTVYTNPQTAKYSVSLVANQTIPIAPFNVCNFYFNYTLKRGWIFDGSKIRFSANNLFDAHNIVGVSEANKGSYTQGQSAASVWAYSTSTTPGATGGGADQLTLLPGRSFTVSFTIGISPKKL